MVAEIQKEEIKAVLRLKLNTDKLKLWLPPYTDESGAKGETPNALIIHCAEVTGYGMELIEECVEELRCHALAKLEARKKLDKDGIATFKVKLTGNVPPSYSGERKINIQLSLLENGKGLKEKIQSICGIQAEKLKLICNGHIVEDNTFLSTQNISNNSTVLAICLKESEAEAKKHNEEIGCVSETREAAELLASMEDGGEDDRGNYYLQIADQSGKPLDIPNEERKALALAMTLHEKGRTLMKKRDYGKALYILLEADKEFKKCRSSILDAVDNYALVCLDVVWCYLRLQNVNDLPDAEARLRACDECFRKSYGPNLERLALVKGGTGTEKALFMRLHLLQGVVAYHQQSKLQAEQLLTRAEGELKALLVGEEEMTQVMSMGFSAQEARLGLRLCEGNVQLAVSHIMKKREEKQQIIQDEKEKQRKKRIQSKLGTTAKGDKINIDHYENLISMGYPKGSAAEALRQSDNDINLAIQALHEHPELLALPDPEPPKFQLTDEMMAQLVSLGFDQESSKTALLKFKDVQQAIEELLRSGGVALPEWLQSSNINSASGSSQPSTSQANHNQQKEREKQLIESIIPDIVPEEDGHLDLLLDEEQQILQEYLALLQSTKNK